MTEIPYAVPGVVLAIAAILRVPASRCRSLGISLYNTVWIILFCYLARFLVLGLRPVASGYHQLDRTLEEAAQIAGARPRAAHAHGDRCRWSRPRPRPARC